MRALIALALAATLVSPASAEPWNNWYVLKHNGCEIAGLPPLEFRDRLIAQGHTVPEPEIMRPLAGPLAGMPAMVTIRITDLGLIARFFPSLELCRIGWQKACDLGQLD